jgi:hypothetical protein
MSSDIAMIEVLVGQRLAELRAEAELHRLLRGAARASVARRWPLGWSIRGAGECISYLHLERRCTRVPEVANFVATVT